MEIDWDAGLIKLADLGEDLEGWSQTIGELERAVDDSHAKPAGRNPTSRCRTRSEKR